MGLLDRVRGGRDETARASEDERLDARREEQGESGGDTPEASDPTAARDDVDAARIPGTS